MEINILVNSKKWFWSSMFTYQTIPRKVTMDLDILYESAKNLGIAIHIVPLATINFNEHNYSGKIFVYTSSEDPGLLYKGYIEDIILGLQGQGAIVIPGYTALRAHHNKVFMEICRDILLHDVDTGIRSHYYGCFEEWQKDRMLLYPIVIKAAYGAGSKGVALAHTTKEASNKIKKISLARSLEYMARKVLLKYIPESHYRRKFICQNFVHELDGDYKILVFWDKYFIVERRNRNNDFRASGSGKLIFDCNVPSGIFDFAKTIFKKLNSPVASLDIAYNGERFFLIEFQLVNFGPATIQYSTRYFQQTEDELSWMEIKATSVLEQEYLRSVKNYIISRNL